MPHEKDLRGLIRYCELDTACIGFRIWDLRSKVPSLEIVVSVPCGGFG